jgi:hypothetical protein
VGGKPDSGPAGPDGFYKVSDVGPLLIASNLQDQHKVGRL